MTEELQIERKEIIEMLGIHFESIDNISPLAARIFGLLIIDGPKSGLTFEEIVQKLKASKSSISTNLNLLLKMEKIYYFTISGDRRKHFKASPFSERLTNYIKIIEFEKTIVNKILHYREKTMSSPDEIGYLENIKAYKTYVLKVEKVLLESIPEFKELEKIINCKSNPNKNEEYQILPNCNHDYFCLLWQKKARSS